MFDLVQVWLHDYVWTCLIAVPGSAAFPDNRIPGFRFPYLGQGR